MAGSWTDTVLSTASNPAGTGLVVVAGMARDFLEHRASSRVASPETAGLGEALAQYNFAEPRALEEVASDVFRLLSDYSVRSDHPRYFGLFNPPAKDSAIAGDLIAATVNPQLAVWSHAPAAAEIENKLVRFMGQLIWPSAPVAGTFTSGGTEANHTALLAALSRRYPDWATRGVQSLKARPAIYASSESHLAWIKIARSAGLGSDAVRLVTPSDGLALTSAELSHAIRKDTGYDPVLIVGTAGTTAHGAVDDLHGLAAVAARHDAHFHVDAAWAGGGLLHPDVQQILDGIARADSVTLDPHKWLSVPMACGMYLARSWEALTQAFSVSTSYMPSASVEHHDAYIHSLQWSRRFIGLKLFMALATDGLPGYQAMIQRQLELGTYLKARLKEEGWHIKNASKLPLVCFAPAEQPADEQVLRIERAVADSGDAWISSVRVRKSLVLRACITSFESTHEDVDALMGLLADARASCNGRG